MKKTEKGQIIVILAISLIAILGVTALAVDGSMIYRERREDQTTADSSALSAATTAASSATCAVARSAAIAAAQNYALAQEGVTLANDSSSPNRVEATCSADNKTLDIRIVVTSNPDTTFAKMVSRNELTTSVESVARVTFGSGTFAGGNGIVTTDTSTCSDSNGIKVGDGADCYIQTVGGGIFSNSCINVGGSSYVVAYGAATQYLAGLNLGWSARALNDTTSGATPSNTIINWNIPVPGGVTLQNAQPSAVRATKATTAFPDLDIPVMATSACTGPDYGNVTIPYSSSKYYLDPGTYDSINQTNWTEVVFNPGLYCIKPNGNVNLAQRNVIANNTQFYFMGAGSFMKTNTESLTMNNSSIYLTNGDFIISGGVSATANNITVYVKQGNITISGNSPVVMTAPNCDNSSCGVGPAIKGVLFYMDKTNTSGIMSISGSSSLSMEGTIFAPSSKIVVAGRSGLTTLKSQIIARRIEASGSSAIRLDLTGANLYSPASAGSIELLK